MVISDPEPRRFYPGLHLGLRDAVPPVSRSRETSRTQTTPAASTSPQALAAK